MRQEMNSDSHRYAQFWKCALQVNPHRYGADHRGQNHAMDSRTYASALREVCLSESIKIVGLADHGSITDAENVREVLSAAGIVVFPGFEIATAEKVHWVCLFPEDTSEQQLERYLGNLLLTDPEDGVRPSALGGQDLLTRVKKLGGFCFAAHVTSKRGLLKGNFNNLWMDLRLRAAQIPGRVDELPRQYQQIVLNQNRDYKRDHPIALINAKDVATPEDLKDPRASCLIKMTRPCFPSFLAAFKDTESRVRLADELQEHHYSQIESICIEGGYLDGVTAVISSHLNAVIGGRGTGKTTLLECLRYALDISHKGEDAIRQGDQIIKENLGKAGGRIILKLRSASNHMKPYTVIRRYDEPPRVIDEHNNESILHPGKDLLPGVEIYGQNEIHELAKSPNTLTRVLDRFLPNSAEQETRLKFALRQLKENSGRLVRAQEKRDETEARIAQLPKLEEQARHFREQGLEEKLKRVPFLEKERQLRPRILEEAQCVRQAAVQFEESLPDLVFLSDKALEDLPHAQLFQECRCLLKSLESSLRQKLGEIVVSIQETEISLNVLAETLSGAVEASQAQLEKDFDRLPVTAGKDGKEIGRTYQQLLRQIEQVSPLRAQLNNLDNLVEELEQARRNLLGEISDIRNARTCAKQNAVNDLNNRLAGKLRITVVPNGLRQPLRDFFQQLPGFGARRTEWVDQAQDLTISGLIESIDEGKDALLEREWGLTAGLAETLSRMTPAQRHALQAIDLEDRAEIELNVSHSGERYRHLDYLSTGQQSTAILHLLLLDNPDPLIMDQPEDNLDNAFIAERIVQELREAKLQRQFLFATHNANIPVFGDAEWIGVCSPGVQDQAVLSTDGQGSIDIPEIRDQVANVLEGGKEAFMQRKEKYGFDF